jgi:hypothetical protein
MFEEIFTYQRLYQVIFSLIVLLAVFVFRRLVNGSINRFSERAKLEKHVQNILKVIADILIYAVGITVTLQAWGLPIEWFISVSALTGAAVGFASTQTLGNLLAGLYIMISKPFEVEDYVKIDLTEGEVREITLNYVKIFTPTYTMLEIPNKTVLNSLITQCISDEIIDYSFPLSFAGKVYPTSWISISDLLDKIVGPSINEFWIKYSDTLPRKPEVSVSRVDFLNRTLMIRMFLPKGEAKLLYDLQPELQKKILERLDEFREEKD